MFSISPLIGVSYVVFEHTPFHAQEGWKVSWPSNLMCFTYYSDTAPSPKGLESGFRDLWKCHYIMQSSIIELYPFPRKYAEAESFNLVIINSTETLGAAAAPAVAVAVMVTGSPCDLGLT